MKLRLASLSLDLDNQWSYMKTHGDSGWESFPSYLDIVVPRVLDFLAEREHQITFFIVGQDAALDCNTNALSSLSAAGHEIGNHSFHHEPWLHLYSEAEVEAEIRNAEDAIEKATGVRPRGFRGPGFSLSENVLRVLERRGYQYDASTFPTYLGPVARAYYFFHSRNLTDEERQQRKMLFGSFRDGLRSIKPYRWQVGTHGMVELPVTTMPLFKVPIHVSYLLYLAGYSRWAAKNYFRMALSLCRFTGVEPSLLLHPLDFLGKNDGLSELAFFPGMNRSSDWKLQLVQEVLEMYESQFEIVPMGVHAHAIQQRSGLQQVAGHRAEPPASRRQAA